MTFKFSFANPLNHEEHVYNHFLFHQKLSLCDVGKI